MLDVIETEGLQENALRTGARFAEALQSLAARHDALGQIRGAGLFLGVDIVTEGAPDSALAARVVNDLRAARVLISATGPAAHVLKIRPPLVFDRDHADLFCERLDTVLTVLGR